MKLCWFLVSIILAIPFSAVARSYTTDFNTTENPLSENGAWSNTGLDWTAVVTENGIAHGTHHATGYNDSYAILSGFAPDQTAEATIYKSGTFTHNQEIELLLRWSQSAHEARGYEINWDARNHYGYLVRWNGRLGDFTLLKRLSFPHPPRTGDIMKARVTGDRIEVYLNDELVGRFHDGKWPDGNPGIGFYSDDPSGNQNARFGITRFSASDTK